MKINLKNDPKPIVGNLYVLKNNGNKDNNLRNKFAESWQREALRSLQIGKLCCEKRDYPSCIFNLQQSIEKIIKAELIGANLIENPREINHKPHLPYQKIFEERLLEEKDEKVTEVISKCNKWISSKDKESVSFFERCQGLRVIIEDIDDFANGFLGISYGITQAFQKQYRIIVLAYLFYDTQNNSRYPDLKNEIIITPEKLYPKGLQKYLPYIIQQIEIVLNLQNSPLIADMINKALKKDE